MDSEFILLFAFALSMLAISIPILSIITQKTELATSTIIHKRKVTGMIYGGNGVMVPYLSYQFTMADGTIVNVPIEVYNAYNIGDKYTYEKPKEK